MATGRSIQLIMQVGGFLVACKPARLGLLVATFSVKVPDFDIMADNANGYSIPIQVKAYLA
jgi:hypothetical protein